MEKRNTLNLVLNEIKKDSSDPTIIPCTYIILDFDVSSNNVKVVQDVALEGGKTLINKPIVAKYHPVTNANANDDNFGSHEEFMSKDKYGKDKLERDTVPIGVFTTEGYLTEISDNGVMKKVMAADGVLWYSKFKDACDLLLDWYDRGIKINTSCEYLYKNFSFIDGVEYHHSPLLFESHAILASENRGTHNEVIPAYDTAALLSLNELQEFNLLVAQAADQTKEDKLVDDLTQKPDLETEIVATDDVVNPDGTQLNEQQDNELQTQFNEVSMDETRRDIREQVKGTLGKNSYTWVSDLYQTYAILSIEDYDANTYDYYKYDYSIENDVVIVDLDSKVEVKEKRDWVAVTNELETKINELTTAKADLEEKFNAASETIISLNSQVEELTPYRDTQLNAQRETALQEKTNHFCSKFEAVGAKEKFDSEEVQALIAQSIEENETGKDALLSLNTMIVELIQAKQEEESTSDVTMLGLASYRKDLVKTDDSFESRYKL